MPLGELPPLQSLTLQDARLLCYRNFGAPVGSHPAQGMALYFHGTPSCHLEAQVMNREAARLGLALVSMDRSGIGLSTYKRKSTLETVADDARQLLSHLGFAQASVIGTSGARALRRAPAVHASGAAANKNCRRSPASDPRAGR